MKRHTPANRLIGDMPTVGIRPTIDGRLQGVRESLERTTMAMAQSVAGAHRVRACATRTACACGASSPTRCIGGVAEAAMAAEKFRKAGVGVSLTVTPCWCYGSETMDMDPHVPKAVWGFNGTERPGAVYLAAVSAAHTQKGLPAFTIYGRDVQDKGDTTIPADVREKILRVRAQRPRGGHGARASRTCRSAARRWASRARLSATTSSRTTSACASSRWT